MPVARPSQSDYTGKSGPNQISPESHEEDTLFPEARTESYAVAMESQGILRRMALG